MKPIIKLWVGLFLLFTFCCSLAFAESKVVTSEGKYVMGDLDTKKEARSLALMEAKRSALEQAGTYLESSSEVKNYELTKDEINSLTSGVVSVEVLKEDWKMSGENLMVTVLIRATVDTSNLGERISALKDDKESVEELKDVQTQLAALQQELQKLKAERTDEISQKQAETPKKELKKKYVAIVNKMSALDHLKSANADLANGRLEEALAGFNEALSVNPGMAEAYAGQAIALMRMGRPHKALNKIDSALDIVPNSARAHAVKSFILAQSNRYGRALWSINKAIELNPQNPRFYSGRGEIYLRLQKPGLAFKDFERACRMGDRKACNRTKALAQRLKTRQRDNQVSVPHRRPSQPGH
jgi:Flp pilus assembly protein TadD